VPFAAPAMPVPEPVSLRCGQPPELSVGPARPPYTPSGFGWSPGNTPLPVTCACLRVRETTRTRPRAMGAARPSGSRARAGGGGLPPARVVASRPDRAPQRHQLKAGVPGAPPVEKHIAGMAVPGDVVEQRGQPRSRTKAQGGGRAETYGAPACGGGPAWSAAGAAALPARMPNGWRPPAPADARRLDACPRPRPQSA
jgi:hypothetical protein